MPAQLRPHCFAGIPPMIWTQRPYFSAERKCSGPHQECCTLKQSAPAPLLSLEMDASVDRSGIMPPRIAPNLIQPWLEGMCVISDALGQLSAANVEDRGAVYTRREVVDFILDLVGYTADTPLHKLRLLEPSFGDGDFLLPAIERLFDSLDRSGLQGAAALPELASCIRAVELHQSTFESTLAKVIGLLQSRGVQPAAAHSLAASWLLQGDFLLTPLDGAFNVVVGNPPYVRQERVPSVLMAEYRARFTTIYDRADLYIPFIECALRALAPDGQLGFICADRWMKNRYGGPLRKLIADSYRLKIFVDMVDTPAFQSEVVAYPAITVIAREAPGPTRIAHRPAIQAPSLSRLAQELRAPASAPQSETVRELDGITSGDAPWILESDDQLAILRRLERTFPTLEEAGCTVGIGVATGADKAFIGPFDALDVEDDRKLPLVMTRDILSGEVQWRGLGVVNPFAEDGSLVNLATYPRLQRFLSVRKDQIVRRHVAQKSPANWYRTIDRIYPELARVPKLLIPDIKGGAHIVYEPGRLYPHHNLYYITSSHWDLQALQAVLLSGIARLFVSIYSTRMRGGYLRFQAQYLRRIRVPRWNDVPPPLREALIEAARRKDQAACNEATFTLYGLTAAERAAIGGNGE